MRSSTSRLRKVVASVAETLRESEFVRTSPRIPIIEEDSKAVSEEIAQAAGKAHGCFVIVSFESASTDNEGPGPILSECLFNVAVIEFPGLWRSRANAPTCTEIAEAVARLLHHHAPLDPDGNAIGNGVLSFEEMAQSSGESDLTQTLTFSFPIALSTEAPER